MMITFTPHGDKRARKVKSQRSDCEINKKRGGRMSALATNPRQKATGSAHQVTASFFFPSIWWQTKTYHLRALHQQQQQYGNVIQSSGDKWPPWKPSLSAIWEGCSVDPTEQHFSSLPCRYKTKMVHDLISCHMERNFDQSRLFAKVEWPSMIK